MKCGTGGDPAAGAGCSLAKDPGDAAPVEGSTLTPLTSVTRPRVARSSRVSSKKMPKRTNEETKITALNGLSCRKCMKNSATSEAFTVAMSTATTVLAEPRSTYETATVITVRKISATKIPHMNTNDEIWA